MRRRAEPQRQIARMRAGDPDAWGDLYRELAPAVYRFCRRILSSPQDAEDATAEIFLKVRLRLDQYDTSRPFHPWLYRLAANHCWDDLRRSRIRHTEPLDPSGLGQESAEPGPLEYLLIQHERREIRAALAELGDRERMVLVMRYFGELTYEEMADVLGVTSSLIGVLLLRARRNLRKVLAKQGVS